MSKKKTIPSAKADAKALKKQISRDFAVAKTRYNQTPPANTVYVGSAGKYGVEYFGYDPQVLHVPVGTTVTFQMTKGSFENHTASNPILTSRHHAVDTSKSPHLNTAPPAPTAEK